MTAGFDCWIWAIGSVVCVSCFEMKTLLKPEDKEEIIARFQSARPTSQRFWGEMSAQQMVCHLTDRFRMYMSLKLTVSVPVPYPRYLLKWIALWVPSRGQGIQDCVSKAAI